MIAFLSFVLNTDIKEFRVTLYFLLYTAFKSHRSKHLFLPLLHSYVLSTVMSPCKAIIVP